MTVGAGRFSTLSWGPGTAYAVVALDGARDLPPIRSRDTPMDGRHGSTTLPDFCDNATLTLTLGIRGDQHGFEGGGAPGSLEQLSVDVRDATPPQDVPLQLFYRDNFRFRWAKVRRRALPEDSSALWKLGQAIIEFDCPDPREYEAFETWFGPLTLPTSGGGIGFPTGFPVDFGPGGVGGDQALLNRGNVPTKLLARIGGPVTNPSITVNGVTLAFNYTLAGGEFLDIDTEARTVLLMGTASRRGAVAAGSKWPMVPPGASAFQFRAGSAFDPSSYVWAHYRGAWL